VTSTSLSATPKTRAVEVSYKPKPNYTDEARKARIQGDVAVEVLFSASGQAQPLRVISGLGFGLDENAIAAATQIQFRPAEQNGKAVNQTAIVHFIFQLAL
jgi:TonB family protein